MSQKLYRVRESFVLYTKGGRVHFSVGDGVYSADHPAVKSHPDSFSEVQIQGAVEQATAAPGESRAAAKPKKAAGK
jgi:hypothetical protein